MRDKFQEIADHDTVRIAIIEVTPYKKWTDPIRMRRNSRLYLRGALALLVFFQIALAQTTEDPLVAFTRREIATTQSYKPVAGYVPDSRTAIAVAIACLTPVWGEADIVASKPWHTGLKDGVWTVVGTFHGTGDGGAPVIQIEQSTGAIRFLGHTQ